PGLYRLVNPYYFWVADIMGASSNYLEGNFYMTIDATDPQKVTMPVSELGVFLSPQQGQLITASVDQVLQNGVINGVLEDGVITFGVRGLFGSLQALFEQGRGNYCNLQGFFCVDMNAGSAPSAQTKARKANRIDFNNLKANAPVEAKVLMNRKQNLSNKQTRDFILSNVERNTIR
ncbi:MAG: hypothetical protein K2F78_06110, partial [Muribaculaceae bacterium]|nr:hypothetical protein [Muribaculaceae bacterium]